MANLPGTINAVAPRPRVAARRRAPPPPKETGPQKRTSPREMSNVPSVQTPIEKPVLPPPTVITAPEETHWVYATVGPSHLRATTNPDDILCVKDTRVMLLYPMVSDPDTGIVSMKVKRVDEYTGQLYCDWVNVYDPNSDTRTVSDFSLFP